MSAEYTIPALRDTANDLRSKAAAHYAAEDIKAQQILANARRDADAMCAAAAEIDADADAKERQQNQQQGGPAGQTMPCASCGHPLVQDQLGWQHTDPAAGAVCLANPPVPAPQTAPFEAVQVPAVTRTDGQLNIGEAGQA